eukprot:scaffold97112_cov54-Cyclotella_meneghiniana.AAC.1
MPDWEAGRDQCWERWVRNWMGLRDSPGRSGQMMILAKELAYGDRHDATNPFQWDRVVLNLPGSEHYEPRLPWVFKLRKDGTVASEAYIYVDDNRVTAATKIQAWWAARRLASFLSRLGLQDAARKRTSPSQIPGPWAGSVAHTQEGVFLLVTPEKWQKTKDLVSEVAAMLTESTDGKLDRKRLEQIRGFLIYVSRTYPWMPPYLKGLHLTIDGWRPGRDEEGFKLKEGVRRKRPYIAWEWELEYLVDLTPEEFAKRMGCEGPDRVFPVERLRRDIDALTQLLSGESPSITVVRSGSYFSFYLMGDASGKGFGSAYWDRSDLYWESGHYGPKMQEESSNFREADNLVRRLEKMESEGILADKEIFVFTDNSTFEGAFYKGHSTSEKICDIILRLRLVQQRTGCVLHVTHVAGTRMKEAGIDGLSRGDLLEGMLSGGDGPWRFLPLSEGADTRSGGSVVSWVRSWWGTDSATSWCKAPLKVLTPTDWFSLKDVVGPRLWVPPPAAMHTALEMFNEDRIARPHLPHVFVVPRLMTG